MKDATQEVHSIGAGAGIDLSDPNSFWAMQLLAARANGALALGLEQGVARGRWVMEWSGGTHGIALVNLRGKANAQMEAACGFLATGERVVRWRAGEEVFDLSLRPVATGCRGGQLLENRTLAPLWAWLERVEAAWRANTLEGALPGARQGMERGRMQASSSRPHQG